MKNNSYKNKKIITKKYKSSYIRTFSNIINKNKDYFNNYKNNTLNIENNKYEEIRTNITLGNKINEMKFENKTIQTGNIITPKIINRKKKTLLNKYNISKISHLKNISKSLKYKNISLSNNDKNNSNRIDKIKSSLFPSDTNLNCKNNNKNIIKINNNDNINFIENNKILYLKDNFNKAKKKIISGYKDKRNNYKNRCINIYTLLSLKNNNIN